MSKFTNSEANACVIQSIEKEVHGSNITYSVNLLDADGNGYSAQLEGLGADPSKTDIKAAVIVEVLKLGKKPVQVAKILSSYSNSDGKGIGESLG